MLSQKPNVSPPAAAVPSFADTAERVLYQVQYQGFESPRSHLIDPLYGELCLIIAEVFIMDPTAVININGVKTQVSVLQEVFSQLHNDHVRLVFTNFQDVSSKVYNKKAYLRTALYNAVFELEANYTNNLYSGWPSD
jgi:hypothetical protein